MSEQSQSFTAAEYQFPLSRLGGRIPVEQISRQSATLIISAKGPAIEVIMDQSFPVYSAGALSSTSSAGFSGSCVNKGDPISDINKVIVWQTPNNGTRYVLKQQRHPLPMAIDDI